MDKVRDMFVCKNMHEAVEKQLELSKQGIDSSSYQTVSDYVIVLSYVSEGSEKNDSK